MNFGAREKAAYHTAATYKPKHQGTISLKVFAQSPAEVTLPAPPANRFWRERYIIWPRRLTSGRLAYCEHVWQRGNEFCEWEM